METGILVIGGLVVVLLVIWFFGDLDKVAKAYRDMNDDHDRFD